MLNENQQQEILNLISNKEKFEEKLKLLINKKSKLDILYNRPTLAKLNVKEVVHSGVEICIGIRKKSIIESFSQVSFSDDPFSKKIEMKALKL